MTNGVGVTFLSGEDTDLYMEAVSNDTATLTYAYEGTGEAAGISCAASLKMTAWGLEFVEDTGTRYNFSPSLGETGTVRVAVTSELPAGGMPGHHFKVEIVRETTSGDQHVDWLDVTDEQEYGWARPVDFSSKSFCWDGIPDVFGASASQATGLDVFTGLVANVSRALPAVTLDQCVPPPLYTAVASVRRNGDGTVVCEARKRIYVPQVVRLEYDADAVTLIKQGHSGYTNGAPCVFINPMSDAEWETQRTRIRLLAQALMDVAGTNVRFIDNNASINTPFTTLTMRVSQNPEFGVTTGDFLNVNPEGLGYLNANALRDGVGLYWDNHPEFQLPVLANEVGFLWGKVAAHECAHALGLVAPGNVLGGSTGWHNPGTSGVQVMDKGENITYEQRLGRGEDWVWCPMNRDYLLFLLPKQ